MKEDFFHIIIDRPRTGGDGGKSKPPKGSKRRRQKEGLENAPKFESSAPHRVYGWDAKQLNEHLGPLIRFLRSNIGRPWSIVFSEICQHISQNSATQSHVRDHVMHEVHLNTILVGRKVVRSTGESMYHRFFVHPSSGLLCENKDSIYRFNRKHARQRIPRFIAGSDADHIYKVVGGIWYEITLAPVPNTYHAIFYDVVFSPRRKGTELLYPAKMSTKDRMNEYGDCYKYAGSKRQVNKRELKKLKLWDTPLGIYHRNHPEEEP